MARITIDVDDRDMATFREMFKTVSDQETVAEALRQGIEAGQRRRQALARLGEQEETERRQDALDRLRELTADGALDLEFLREYLERKKLR